MWAVEEQGFVRSESYVLGAPFIVDALYKRPEQYQINDAYQQVSNVIRGLLHGS
jgi:hypothetical protein